MFTKTLSALCITTVLFSCGGNNQQTTTPAATDAAKTEHHDSALVKKPDFSTVHFDSEKDLSCGMSIKSGVEDTAHYKGKVYGFCARECKDDFLKDPEAALAKK